MILNNYEGNVKNNTEEINLYYNGTWYFEEAANYFVDEKSMQSFFDTINNSVLIENAAKPLSDNDYINIKTFDTENNLLDDIYIYKNNPEVIKYADNGNLFKATKTNSIPLNPEQWLPSPLLAIEESDISAVNINGFYAPKAELDEIKPFTKNIEEFFKILQNVNYDGIIGKELFREEYPQANMKEIKLYLEGGLNYILQIYKTEDGYYVQISPERELIAHILVNKIIEEKKQYYDNWLFLLDDKQGNFLFNLKINQEQN